MLKFSSHLLSPPLLLSLCNSLSLVHSRESASPSPRNYAIRLQSPYKVDLKQLDFIQSTDFISIRKFIYHNFSFIGIFVKSTANNFFPSILAALFILFVHTTNAWAEHCSFVCICDCCLKMQIITRLLHAWVIELPFSRVYCLCRVDL